jgi:3-oxoadipate enol-lactonase
MPTTRSGDADIHYELHGDGPGQPALMLMGLGTDLDGWERVTPALGKRRRLLLLDNRGVGRSSKPRGPYTTALLADDAAAVMEAAGIGRAHVVGISLGGAIAQELALRHPERVRSLALLATFAGLDARMRATADEGTQKIAARAGAAKNMMASMQAMADANVPVDPKMIYQFLMPLVLSKEFMERERAELRAIFERSMSRGISMHGFAAQLGAAWSHDTVARLGEIKVPTLVATGTADRLVPPTQSRVLHDKIPGARYAEIPGGVHGLPLEHAGELGEMLENWLEEVDGV